MKLNREERELLESIDNDEWKSIPDLDEELERSRAIVRATGTKDERMNIRMSRRDMMALKARALGQGIPYQTLVSNILRQWLRRASAAESASIRLAELFSEDELRGLSSLVEKRLKRPRKQGILAVRDSSGAFRPQPTPRDPLLEKLTPGDPRAVAEVTLTQGDVDDLFGRLFGIQGRPELTDDESRMLRVALDRLHPLVTRIRQ